MLRAEHRQLDTHLSKRRAAQAATAGGVPLRRMPLRHRRGELYVGKERLASVNGNHSMSAGRRIWMIDVDGHSGVEQASHLAGRTRCLPSGPYGPRTKRSRCPTPSRNGRTVPWRNGKTGCACGPLCAQSAGRHERQPSPAAAATASIAGWTACRAHRCCHWPRRGRCAQGCRDRLGRQVTANRHVRNLEK